VILRPSIAVLTLSIYCARAETTLASKTSYTVSLFQTGKVDIISKISISRRIDMLPLGLLPIAFSKCLALQQTVVSLPRNMFDMSSTNWQFPHQTFCLRSKALAPHSWFAPTMRHVYYYPHYKCFPSTPSYEPRHCVGVGTHIGDDLTIKILTSSRKIIFRSIIPFVIRATIRHKCCATYRVPNVIENRTRSL
jgi:hypothetical protein